MSVRIPYPHPDPITGDWDPWAMLRNLKVLAQRTFDSVAETLGVAHGGTNITSYAIGDILHASAATVLSKLADVATGNALISGGVGAAPAWGKIGLTTHVSGDLPYANLAQGSALSVLGVTGNAAADVASIAAGTDHHLLRRSGTALDFGLLVNANVAAAAGIVSTKLAASGARVTNSAAQSVADNTVTALTFNTEVTDTDAYHSTVSNTSRLTAPSDGLYVVVANCAVAAGTDYSYILLSIIQDGATTLGSMRFTPTTFNAFQDVTVVTIVYLTSTQYVEAHVAQDNTANAARDITNQRFSIARIGA